MLKEEKLKTDIIDYFGKLIKVANLNSNETLVTLPLWMADGDGVAFYIITDDKNNCRLTDDGDLINVHCSPNPKVKEKIKDLLIRNGFEVDDKYIISYNTNKSDLVSNINHFANTMIQMSYIKE